MNAAIKILIMKILKALVNWSLNRLYNFIDKDRDGKLDYDEIAKFVDSGNFNQIWNNRESLTYN